MTHSKIYTTRLDDGSYLIVSPTAPRFCVTGATEAEANQKAEAAFAYHSTLSVVPPAPPRKEIVRPAYSARKLEHAAA